MNHFFDVGANIGQTFDDYLLRNPQFDGWKVWCFEPSPRHVPLLINRALELGSRYQIVICPFGLRDTTGTHSFFQKSDDPRGDSFERFLASDHVTTNLETSYQLEVAVVGITDFILDHTAPGDRIVLKLDCEGSEFAILRELMSETEWAGLARQRIDRILIEWHSITPNQGDSFNHQRALEAAAAQHGIPLLKWEF